MKRLFALLVVCLLPGSASWAADAAATENPATPTVSAVSPAPTFVEKAVTPKLLEELRKGGHVLYMRHGLTDNSKPDRVVPLFDVHDCATQRNLSDTGRDLIKKVGMAMREAKIPFSRVLASPMCRAKESAQLAIGNQFKLHEALMSSAHLTSAERKPRIDALKKLMLEPVPPGGNTLLVGHAGNMADLIGFFVKPEGTVLVFRQDQAGGFEYQASIHPDDRGRLAH